MTNCPMSLTTQQQLYDYAVRWRLSTSALSDPRAFFAALPRLVPDPKPTHSYIGLIAMAILSSPQQQLVLSDIYQWILERYPYFRTKGSGWRNSIRHNLSLNDCFVKAGRSGNGKGHYWAIHPANLADFVSGDFRRQRAQRRARKSMGLPVPEDEGDDGDDDGDDNDDERDPFTRFGSTVNSSPLPVQPNPSTANDRKRRFDVDSLLAPDGHRPVKRQRCYSNRNGEVHSPLSKSDRSTDTEAST